MSSTTAETPLVNARANSPTRGGEASDNGDAANKNARAQAPMRRFRPYAPLDHAARVYAGLAMALVYPVTITMGIIVWAVQSLGPVDNTNPITTSIAAAPPSTVDPAFVVVKESPGKSTGEKIGGAVVNMLIVVGAITVITFLMVFLYKYGCIKVLYVWLGVSAALVFFFLSGLFFDLVATRYQLPYDYVIFGLLVWNFGVAGLLSVFYMAHPIISQGYLVVVSVIVTWGLTQTPEWTTWMILVGVAIYDILAVLCPKGPLHLLVKAAQERQEPIPGFIYDADAGPAIELREQHPQPIRPMQPAAATGSTNKNTAVAAAKNDKRDAEGAETTSHARNDNDDTDNTLAPRPVNPMDELPHQGRDAATTSVSRDNLDDLLGSPPPPAADADADAAEGGMLDIVPNYGATAATSAGPLSASSSWTATSAPSAKADDDILFAVRTDDKRADAEEEKKTRKENAEAEKKNVLQQQQQQQQREQEKAKPPSKRNDSDEEEEELDPFEAAHHATPFKLGLGDFIFYSLLVGRASMDLTTTQTPWLVCYINIIGGMGATLASLLFLRGKVPALPALPFSIFAATIAFFITRYVTTPYWDMLTLHAYTP